ncbi:MAG TPA: endonuclease/exonuclease/phosphatase family protein [Blastocatellia bacterium]|nr:endonuclease/exonuclease/phosphatase family protein [Blastocatellia bacterium]
MALSLSIASYNILADSYVMPKWYPNVDPEVLRWDRRKFSLAERAARLDADIICLQEVEADAYALLEGNLAANGYSGVYAKKGAGKPDGCAMFFRQARLRFAGADTLYYCDGRLDVPDSGHLALIVNFECEWGVVKVATTHLKWGQDNKAPEQHIGYREIRELIDERFKPDQTAHAQTAQTEWIICGDLNAQSGDPVVRELLDAGFVDAYAGREQATCNPNGRAKRIDYIFHTPGLSAEPARLMEIDDLTPLPSADEPSDHLPIMAAFRKA